MIQRFEPIEGRNMEIIESVMTSPEVAQLPESEQFKVRLCTEEVEENILCYSGSTWVEVTTAFENGVFSVNFKDGGVKFDPLAKPDPDVDAPLEQRSIGGLGIFLCKQMMTSVEYKFENGCNNFTMYRKIDI